MHNQQPPVDSDGTPYIFSGCHTLGWQCERMREVRDLQARGKLLDDVERTIGRVLAAIAGHAEIEVLMEAYRPSRAYEPYELTERRRMPRHKRDETFDRPQLLDRPARRKTPRGAGTWTFHWHLDEPVDTDVSKDEFRRTVRRDQRQPRRQRPRQGAQRRKCQQVITQSICEKHC